MHDLLIAIGAAAAASSAHAGAPYPDGCFSPPICVTVKRTKSTLDFNYESPADQPYTVAVSSSQHGLGGINHSIQFKTSDLPRTQKLFSHEIPAHGRWDYEWHIAFHPGVQTAQHDPTTVYALPFKSGRWVYVVQTYDDSRSHARSASRSIRRAHRHSSPCRARWSGDRHQPDFERVEPRRFQECPRQLCVGPTQRRHDRLLPAPAAGWGRSRRRAGREDRTVARLFRLHWPMQRPASSLSRVDAFAGAHGANSWPDACRGGWPSL
jgi:hypothetical protein